MFNLYTCYVACCLQGNTELAAPGVSASTFYTSQGLLAVSTIKCVCVEHQGLQVYLQATAHAPFVQIWQMLCPPGTSASVDHFDVIFLQSLGHAHDAKLVKAFGRAIVPHQ